MNKRAPMGVLASELNSKRLAFNMVCRNVMVLSGPFVLVLRHCVRLSDCVDLENFGSTDALVGDRNASYGFSNREGGYGGDASGEGESRGSQCRPRDATEVPGVFGKAGVGSRPAHRVRVPQVGGTPLSGKEGPLEFSVVGAPAGPPGRLQPVPLQAQGPRQVLSLAQGRQSLCVSRGRGLGGSTLYAGGGR